MSEQEWICKEHNKPIVCYCIDQHHCKDRRLCLDCLFSSHSDFPKINVPKIEDFQNQIKEKLVGYQKAQPFDLLKIIKQLQDQMNKIFLDIQSSAQQFLSLFDQIDKDILEIKYKLENNSFLSFSESDRNIMIQIIRDNLLEDKYKLQHSFRNYVQNSQDLLKTSVEKCAQFYSKLITKNIKETITNNISIESESVIGLKQGDAYYCFEDGTKQFAGFYNLGMKEGKWNVYCGQSYQPDKVPGWFVSQKKQIIYKLKNFKDGVEIFDSIKTNQNGQEEVFIETFGLKEEVQFRGQCIKGQRVGQWHYLLDGKIIGGGEFNQFGVKIGKWIECDQMYQNYCQVVYSGEYRNGQRFGQWTTLYENKKIGGGNYDDKGVKSGNWTDLHENFWDRCQVVYSGKYRNGLRFGQWTTLYENDKIGGGNYDDKGVKSGNWTDLHENFWDRCQVVYSGEYRNGQRLGQWTTLYKNNKIGGGNYDDKGVKSGNWTDLHENFSDRCQVVYSGEYRIGQRFGQWTTLYRNNKIGGGNYDDKGVKSGNWTDLHENFWDYCQMVYSGEYRNGLRFGQWTTLYRNNKIGGGNYDDKGVKSGNWTDLHENFWDYCQMVYSGEYRNGQRFGQWTTLYENNKIGGGNYDDKGVKSGNWTDLHENSWNNCQVVYSGEYRNGQRLGQWTTLYENDKIGGGNYDDKGVKSGNWTDLHENFSYDCQVVYSGKYRNGLRFGQWTTLYENNKIGGGNYDDKGVKSGNWTDLHENFWHACQVVYSGEYRNGQRFGQWTTLSKNNKIGGGNYDDKGVKSGNWTDLHNNFSDDCQVVYSGEYRNGLRFGQWNKTNLESNTTEKYQEYHN